MRIITTSEFEAAHRQLGDPSKCGKLHGHNWRVQFEIQYHELNPIGYLADFKDLTSLTDMYDHCVLLHMDDPLLRVLQNAEQNVLACNGNPTCENIAMWLYRAVTNKVPEGSIVQITVYENNRSRATYNTWDDKNEIK